MIGSVTKNGGRREMETYDRICDQKRREKRNGTYDRVRDQNGGRREMETYDRICDQKRRQKRNGNLWIGSVTKNGGRREM